MTESLYTPTGMKIRGKYENHRNQENADLFKAIINRVFGEGDVIIAHHLAYVDEYHHDGYDIQFVQEIASADTLIFDDEVAAVLWGEDAPDVLTELALLPCPARDDVLRVEYEKRFGPVS